MGSRRSAFHAARLTYIVRIVFSLCTLSVLTTSVRTSAQERQDDDRSHEPKLIESSVAG